MKKRWIAGITAAVLAVTGVAATLSNVIISSADDDEDEDTATASSSEYNYAEALQKSMFFYEVQQSGTLPDWNEVSWRDDSMTTDYIEGGWYDAGDHLKFTLTNAYSATMLAWGYLEYGEGVEACGESEEYLNNLGWALDYVAACDLGDEIVYMIGDGSFDHNWWGSAEVYMLEYEQRTGDTERPYYTCNDSCIEAQMAAALAAGYLCFKDTDSERAEGYLEHAIACFERADENRSIGDDTAETSYYSISTFYDDLFYAANWLYMATGEQSYLDLCESDYIDNLGTMSQSTELKYTWGHCWDDVQQGATLLYAINTGDEEWVEQFQKHLEYWTTGYDGNQITYTDDGLAWLTNWGSLRHATTTAFLAYVAADELFADDDTYYEKYTEFADSMMNYCFGDNDDNFSYVVGIGDDYPQNYHHRTSSGVWDDQWTLIGTERTHAHILYGALVGGPSDSSGTYEDSISNYQCNEVAIDYNAGYTAALCAMVTKYGGDIDEDFPEEETPSWDEFYIEACINQSATSYGEIKVQATNHSAWPARVIEDLSFNYYMDFTEIFDAGLTLDDITVTIGYSEFDCTISDPIQYEDNIYYVKITFDDGTEIMPTGQSECQGEVQFRVAIPSEYTIWDSENDYSYEGLVSQEVAVTEYITMYDGDTLIWGTEPDGTTASTETDDEDTEEETEEETTEEETTETTTETTETTTETTEATTESTTEITETTEATTEETTTSTTEFVEEIYGTGDINLDGSTTAADWVMLSRYLMGDMYLSELAQQYADVNLDDEITNWDAMLLQSYLNETAGIDSLPYIAS